MSGAWNIVKLYAAPSPHRMTRVGNTAIASFVGPTNMSMTPLAALYIAIPICGVLVALFTIEQMVNGWQHGFADRKGAPHHESIGGEVL